MAPLQPASKSDGFALTENTIPHQTFHSERLQQDNRALHEQSQQLDRLQASMHTRTLALRLSAVDFCAYFIFETFGEVNRPMHHHGKPALLKC